MPKHSGAGKVIPGDWLLGNLSSWPGHDQGTGRISRPHQGAVRGLESFGEMQPIRKRSWSEQFGPSSANGAAVLLFRPGGKDAGVVPRLMLDRDMKLTDEQSWL